MEWEGGRQSDNVEDRRGGGGGKFVVGGLGTLLLAAAVYFFTGDPNAALNVATNGMQSSDMTTSPSAPAQNDEATQYVKTILGSTEDVWASEFQKMGKQYPAPQLVLFNEQTVSDCGGAQAATGPFYCPADEKVYLDLSFFNELKTRFGVEGNFAPAYVIAHEIGHHVQNVMGIAGKVNQMQQRVGRAEANRLSVMLELQADFLAGYWARRAGNEYIKLNENDIRSALTAANAIGDDRLQEQSQGYVVPDAFTHGTSEQRMEWFMRGWKAQSIDEGNTFQALQ